MAPKKNKATKEAQETPAAKKAKTDETTEAAKVPEKAAEEPKPKPMEVEKPAEPEEKESDAKPDNRPALKEGIVFEPKDTTLNVVPCGKVLMSLTEGGMQHLIAGARANIGITSGRYMYEVKIIQTFQSEKPRSLIKVGFSTEGSALILGDGEECVAFDQDSGFLEGKKVTRANKMAKLGYGQVIAVLLNLDQKSPNANTISLFRDGVRIADPKPLPEILKGKALFPHVSFRGMSLAVNFGPSAMKELPFKCRLFGSAAKSDTEKTTTALPKDGKYELVLPIAFPDEGTFDWVDTFLAENPQYVELSDRKIVDWAKKSGVYHSSGGKWGNKNNSNDRPAMEFNTNGIAADTVRALIKTVVPLVPRNYLIMEVKSNLLAEERKETLRRFNYPQYKKIAHVVMGEPDDAFKEKQWQRMLADKQKESDMAFKAQKLEEKKKKMLAKRQKELAKAKAKAEKAKKKAEAEEKKKAEEETKADGEKKADDKEEEKKEEKPAEDKKEEAKPADDSDEEDEEEEKDEPMEEEKEESPPIVELTDEDKKTFFPKKPLSDLAPGLLGACFAKFSAPEKSEGFDEIRYEWQKAAGAQEYLNKWVQEKKLTARIETLVPGKNSRDKIAAFKKSMSEWQEKHAAHKKTGEAPAPTKVAADEDIFGVKDISDVGGAPLYKDFGPEDWLLLQLRFELFHMMRAFKEDIADPERVIHEDHIAFYYQKYYGRNLVVKPYGVDTMMQVITLVKDTVTIDSTKKVLASSLSEDFGDSVDIFVKLTEEARRVRQRRIDVGVEGAKLGISDSLLKSAVYYFPKNEKKASGDPKAAGKVHVPAPKKGATSAQP